MTRPPPPRLVHAATAVRTTLQNVTRRMVPPEIGLLELASGFMSTHVVYAAARLGIADVLADGPLSADDIAAGVGSNPDATHRLLRACAALGVFREGADGRFELTPLANGLRSGDARLDAARHHDARRPALPGDLGPAAQHGGDRATWC